MDQLIIFDIKPYQPYPCLIHYSSNLESRDILFVSEFSILELLTRRANDICANNIIVSCSYSLAG